MRNLTGVRAATSWTRIREMLMKKKTKRRLVFGVLLLAVLCGCGGKEKAAEPKKEEPEKQEEIKVVTSEDPKEREETPEAQTDVRNGILVAIDPGHQGFHVDMSATEPNAPGSAQMKAKASTGTVGNYSGIPEYELVLDISLRVKAELQAQGYDVILTREDNDTAISNAERATLANQAGADVMVRIHANSSENARANGALALVPSASNAYVGQLSKESTRLAETVLSAYCQETGMANDGLMENDSMTGINWSTIPVMILEMGFMSNEADDLHMADGAYRTKMVSGIVNGLNTYFGQTPKGTRLSELENQVGQTVQDAQAAGEEWSLYARDLVSGNYAITGSRKMQAASLIKLFIAGAVYENQEAVQAQEAAAGEMQELLKRMLSASDNEAANTLVTRLGSGDAAAGMEKVNAFCSAHRYFDTHMGRLLLASNAEDDNYTSVSDCGHFLEECQSGRLAGAGEILGFLREQERRGKIPAGLPEGTAVANKTGELSDVENDAAVVTVEGKSYILCVMSQKVQTPQAAVERIQRLSALVYETMKQ